MYADWFSSKTDDARATPCRRRPPDNPLGIHTGVHERNVAYYEPWNGRTSADTRSTAKRYISQRLGSVLLSSLSLSLFFSIHANKRHGLSSPSPENPAIRLTLPVATDDRHAPFLSHSAARRLVPVPRRASAVGGPYSARRNRRIISVNRLVSSRSHHWMEPAGAARWWRWLAESRLCSGSWSPGCLQSPLSADG